MKSVLVVALLFAAAVLVVADVPSDLITSLPGFPGPFPSPQYSGYLNVDPSHGRFLHYWLVLSEGNPATDPVVLWMNGGPGCSSLDGFFYEHGPLHFVNNPSRAPGTLPQLYVNPNRWSQLATILYLEAPAGVGWSYSNTPSDYNTNDNITAADNFQALQVFFQSYPELSKNDFYISGESYAGVYVPTLVEQVMIHNQAGQSNIPLKGFMVGNGCTGNGVGVCGGAGDQIRTDFLSAHGLFSQNLATQIAQECEWPNESPACLILLAEASVQVGDVNMYDIYAPCINGASSASKNQSSADRGRLWRVPPKSYEQFKTIASRLGRVGGPDECIDGIDAEAYLNDPSVIEAIHVANSSVTGFNWVICTGRINYNGNIMSLLPLYPTLIENYRTLIYNGDVDCCVPYTDNEAWTSGLGLPLAANGDWHPWAVNSQVAGYATNYAVNGFSFITVKGAGHMVPQYQPVIALEMFRRFLANQPF